jgi:hypothetical protein
MTLMTHPVAYIGESLERVKRYKEGFSKSKEGTEKRRENT